MGMFNWPASAGMTGFPQLAEAGGYSLNFDILEANVVNLVIVIGLLIYFGRGFLGKSLVKRREDIETAISEAEANQEKAAATLAEEQEKLAQAQAEAKKILANAQTNASKAKEQILAEAKTEIQRIKDAGSQDTSASQERAIAEIRQRVTAMALEKVEADLKNQLGNNESAQRKLVDQSIALLGGNS